jgi:hypothetical protein
MDLCDPKKTPRVPLAVRNQAKSLLRHYPTLNDMNLVEMYWEQPNAWIQCPFATKDDLFGELK